MRAVRALATPLLCDATRVPDPERAGAIVKKTSIARILLGLLSLIVLCVLVSADTRGPAPQFTVQTLDGETFTNASIRGRVTLLDFWATWCPVCRSGPGRRGRYRT